MLPRQDTLPGQDNGALMDVFHYEQWVPLTLLVRHC